MKMLQNAPMERGARVKVGAGFLMIATADFIPVASLSILVLGGGLVLAFLGFREDHNAKQR